MNTTTIPFHVQLPTKVPFALPLNQLHRQLTTRVDRRGRCGRRYSLAALLTIAVIAKLAGQSRLEALTAGHANALQNWLAFSVSRA